MWKNNSYCPSSLASGPTSPVSHISWIWSPLSSCLGDQQEKEVVLLPRKMISLLWIKSLFFLWSIPCPCLSQSSLSPLKFSTFLDHSHQVHLSWGLDEDMIIFEVQVRTTGWVAFGITPHGQLPGSDLVIGGVFPNGSIYFSVS